MLGEPQPCIFQITPDCNPTRAVTVEPRASRFISSPTLPVGVATINILRAVRLSFPQVAP